MPAFYLMRIHQHRMFKVSTHHQNNASNQTKTVVLICSLMVEKVPTPRKNT
jgi:hypothetical protein